MTQLCVAQQCKRGVLYCREAHGSQVLIKVLRNWGPDFLTVLLVPACAD